MDEVEVSRTADALQGADFSSIGIEPTMMLTSGNVLAPTLNPYVEIDSTVSTQSEYEQTIQL